MLSRPKDVQVPESGHLIYLLQWFSNRPRTCPSEMNYERTGDIEVDFHLPGVDVLS